jgi:hypothetical protein
MLLSIHLYYVFQFSLSISQDVDAGSNSSLKWWLYKHFHWRLAEQERSFT